MDTRSKVRDESPARQAIGNGRYELCEFVSKGGMGAVYRARDVELDRWVAVKCLLDVAKEGSRELAVKEARTLASLAHPNIMRVYDILSVGDQVWIVTEWLEGRCLAQLPLPLPPTAVLAVMTQVYDALAAAHQAGIIHRDIKPANVMIGNDGRVTLIDFGVAFAEGNTTENGATLAGSLRYTDPRILEGETPDAFSDLFSAALLQVELMTGEAVLPELAPLPLYRHIKKNLDGRLDALLDGVYPPMAALARSLATRFGDHAHEGATLTARGAALSAQEMLRKLSTKSPEQYLESTLCKDNLLDPSADQFIAAEAEAQIASPVLPLRQKAAWIAFKAAGTSMRMPLAARRDPSRRERVARMRDEITGKRHFVFSLGLAAAVLVSLLVWLNWLHLPTVVETGDIRLEPGFVPGEELGTRRMSPVLEAPITTPLQELTAPPVTAPVEEAPGEKSAVYLVADAWANVTIDGKDVGRLPQAAPFRLAPGRHVLVLTNPGVEPLETTLDVSPGKTAKLHFHLAPRVTERTIKLAKPGRLIVDGKDKGVVKNETTLKLTYGTHEIRVKRGGKTSAPKNVALGPDSPREIVLE